MDDHDNNGWHQPDRLQKHAEREAEIAEHRRRAAREEAQPVTCPKCGTFSGDDWKQCDGPCPMPSSPHHTHSDALQEALRQSPAIEALTPTNREWVECVSVQDRYDLMKRCLGRALATLQVREDAQPVAWSFELATVRDLETGEYSSWDKPRLSFTKPCVAEGSIRNLVALGPIIRSATAELREALEREAILREGWAAEAFNAGHTISERRWDDADVTEETKDRYRTYVDRKVSAALILQAEQKDSTE